jgi:hypothetical protein
MKTLRNVLLINGASSGATGLLLVAAPGFFASLFDTTATVPFVGTGIFLLAFAVLVIAEGMRKELSPARVRLIILLDTLWVVASVVIIVLGAFAISALGYAMIGAVALWVALMAYLQFAGLKKVAVAN